VQNWENEQNFNHREIWVLAYSHNRNFFNAYILNYI
jgi:hypothetical protein